MAVACNEAHGKFCSTGHPTTDFDLKMDIRLTLIS